MKNEVKCKPYGYYYLFAMCCGLVLIIMIFLFIRDIRHGDNLIMSSIFSLIFFMAFIICCIAANKMIIIFDDNGIKLVTKTEEKTYRYEEFKYCFYCHMSRGGEFIILTPENYGMYRLKKMINMELYHVQIVTDGAIVIPETSLTGKEAKIINKIISEKIPVVESKYLGFSWD